MPRWDDPRLAGRILQRCSVCGRYHASFLVRDAAAGDLRLCARCWRARQQAGRPASAPGRDAVEER